MEYRLKIANCKPAIRDEVSDEKKSLAPIGEYQEMSWRVLGLPFGGPVTGRDLDGESFHPGTEIWLQVGDYVNLTYYHGFGPDSPDTAQNPPVIIGRARYMGVDERGHWFSPSLDPAEPLAQRLINADPGIIRASSGAVAHLVRMSPGGLIDTWAVGELALFDVNEWRLPANDWAVVEVLSVENVQETGPGSVMPLIAPSLPYNHQYGLEKRGEFTMNENEQNEQNEQFVPEVPATEHSLESQIEALRQSVEGLKASLPGVERGAPTTIKSRGEPDYASAWLHYIRTGEAAKLRAAKAALQEGTTTEGGYLVPDGVYNGVIAKRDEESIISRLNVRRVNWRGDKYNFPTEDTSMTKFTIIAEENAITAAENEPTFGQVAITIYHFKKLIKVSQELLEDENSDLEAHLMDQVGRALADTENYYALIGGGSTAPQGVFVGGTAGLTLDSASAIGAGEVPELMGKLGTPYHNGAVFVMKPSTWFYLKGLSSTSQFVFTDGISRLSGTVDGPTLEGYPVILNSNVAAIGASAKSMLFGNFGYLGWVENRALTLQRLNELYAGNGQVGLLFRCRFGCAVLQSEAFQYATHPTA